MNIDAYLSRVGLQERPPANLDGLTALHRAHLRSIPYENLDVQFGRPVTIERPAIYEKIVGRHRGGWCYEMNGIFGWALDQLGFKVTRATGAVMREMFGDVTLRNHLVLRVELDEGLYLADVGFGDGPLGPMRLVPGEFTDGRFAFALSHPEQGWWRFHNHEHGGAKSFDFRLAPADENLLEEKCVFLQTAETSPFVQNLVCQRHTPAGFVILRGRLLRRVGPHGITGERLIQNAGDLVSTLQDEFGLDVPEAAGLWTKVVARHDALFSERPISARPDELSSCPAAK